MIPKEYIPSVKKGMEEAIKNGVLAGYPLEDVRVELWCLYVFTCLFF